MSKLIQKSEVLNMRCTKVCEYCKYYLKYWSKGINGPLDPWGGQNFQCFIKWDGLTVTERGGVGWRAQINFLLKISILNPSVLGVVNSKKLSSSKLFSTDFSPKVTDQTRIFPAASIWSCTLPSNLENATSVCCFKSNWNKISWEKNLLKNVFDPEGLVIFF